MERQHKKAAATAGSGFHRRTKVELARYSYYRLDESDPPYYDTAVDPFVVTLRRANIQLMSRKILLRAMLRCFRCFFFFPVRPTKANLGWHNDWNVYASMGRNVLFQVPVPFPCGCGMFMLVLFTRRTSECVCNATIERLFFTNFAPTTKRPTHHKKYTIKQARFRNARLGSPSKGLIHLWIVAFRRFTRAQYIGPTEIP